MFQSKFLDWEIFKIVALSTIFDFACYKGMNNEQTTYGMPNIGCLLGAVFQRQCSSLAAMLADAGIDVTVPEYLILRALYCRDGMQQCEIGEMIGKDKAAICRTVKALEGKQLVATTPVSHKCLIVSLAPKGIEIRDVIMEIAHNCDNKIKELIGSEKLEIFRNVLLTLNNI